MASTTGETLWEPIDRKGLIVEIISRRKWDEPKLVKPACLRGVAPSFNVVWAKASGPAFIVGSHCVMKSRDFFSPDIPLDVALRTGVVTRSRSRFVYNDNFGSVVLRSEAWLKIHNVFTPGFISLSGIDQEFAFKAAMADCIGVDEDDLLSSFMLTSVIEQIVANAQPVVVAD